MADEADIALQQEEKAWARFEASRGAPLTTTPGPKVCACGEAIPERRRMGGYQECVFCAEEAERYGRR